MERLKIERRGGFTGLQARGEVSLESLSSADRAAIEELFRRKGKLPAAPGADRFVFTITRITAWGTQTVEVPENLVPPDIARAVKDELP